MVRREDDIAFVSSLFIPEEDTDSPLDSVLQEAECVRSRMYTDLSDFGLRDAEICSGGVDKKAYWDWSFVIESDGQSLDCTVILYLDHEGTSRYSVAVTSSTGRSWATADDTDTEAVVSVAFEELKKLFMLHSAGELNVNEK